MKFALLSTIIASSILSLYSLLAPHTAFAHTLKVDGHVGAVLHTDPNDEPIAATTTPLFLAFKNDTQPFDLSAYVLKVTVTAASDHAVHIIPSDEIHDTSNDTLTSSYVFPKEDVYTLTVSGTSTTTDTSRGALPFSLSYDVRVDQIVASRGGFASFLQIHSLHAIIVLIGIGIGTFITVRDERKVRKQMAEGGKQA